MLPHHAYPDAGWPEIRAELQREIAHRREAFPGMVAKGNLSLADADRELALFVAMLADVDRFALPHADRTPPAHTFTWHDRRAALTRELAFRARLYPGWIQKGRLTAADATTRCQRLTALRAIYELGYDWHASNGTAPNWAKLAATPAERDARAEFAWLQCEIAHRDGRDPHQWLATLAVEDPATEREARTTFAKQEEMAL